jgi:hypothetical protein
LGFENITSACVASLDLGRWEFSTQNKGYILHSAATANSAMDYLTKLIEDGVVDSPPKRSTNPMTVSSLSPLRVRTRTTVPILSSNADSRSFHKLYDTPSSSTSCALVKVFSIISCTLISSYDNVCL